jgi:hypothetical protein
MKCASGEQWECKASALGRSEHRLALPTTPFVDD